MIDGRSSGYTLIELVVVVAMLGTLLGLGVPRMAERFFINDVDATEKWLKTETIRLREKAQQTQTTHVLRIDVSGRQFFLKLKTLNPAKPKNRQPPL